MFCPCGTPTDKGDVENELTPLAAELHRMASQHPPELFLGKYVLRTCSSNDGDSLSVLVRVANSAVRQYTVKCVLPTALWCVYVHLRRGQSHQTNGTTSIFQLVYAYVCSFH